MFLNIINFNYSHIIFKHEYAVKILFPLTVADVARRQYGVWVKVPGVFDFGCTPATSNLHTNRNSSTYILLLSFILQTITVFINLIQYILNNVSNFSLF